MMSIKIDHDNATAKFLFYQNTVLYKILIYSYFNRRFYYITLSRFQNVVEFYYVMASMLLKWSVIYIVQWEVGEYMMVVLHFKYHLLSPGVAIGLAR